MKIFLVNLDMVDSKLSAFAVSVRVKFYLLPFDKRSNPRVLESVSENTNLPSFAFGLDVAKPLLCIIEFHCPIYHRRVPLLAESGKSASAVKSEENLFQIGCPRPTACLNACPSSETSASRLQMGVFGEKAIGSIE